VVVVEVLLLRVLVLLAGLLAVLAVLVGPGEARVWSVWTRNQVKFNLNLLCGNYNRVYVQIENFPVYIYKMNGGRRPTRDKGRKPTQPRRGKHPHFK